MSPQNVMDDYGLNVLTLKHLATDFNFYWKIVISPYLDKSFIHTVTHKNILRTDFYVKF